MCDKIVNLSLRFPSQRKLANDDSGEPTRITRSSTRSKTAATKTGSTENATSKANAKRGTKTTATKGKG